MISAGARTDHSELERELRRFVARRVPAAEIDDVVQEVFVRVHRALPELRDEQRFGAWVYRIARHAISDNRRRRARLSGGDPVLSDDLTADEALREPDISARVAEHLEHFVRLLPLPYREAIALTELEGVTYARAAERMGISLSGVKSRVQRGRARLRALLEACCTIGLDARGHVLSCEPRAVCPIATCQGRDACA